jgi:hypothetical protein
LESQPLTGLLYQSRVIDECGAAGGMRIGRGTEALGENLLQCHFDFLDLLSSYWLLKDTSP